MNAAKFETHLIKMLGYMGCILITIFSIAAAIASVATLALIFIEGDYFNLIASVAFAFVAVIGWSIRKNTLI